MAPKHNSRRNRHWKINKRKAEAAAAGEVNEDNTPELSAVNTPATLPPEEPASQASEYPIETVQNNQPEAEGKVPTSTKSDINPAEIRDHRVEFDGYYQDAATQSASSIFARPMPQVLAGSSAQATGKAKGGSRPMMQPALPILLPRTQKATQEPTKSASAPCDNNPAINDQVLPVEQESSEDEIIITSNNGGLQLKFVKKDKSAQVNPSEPSDIAETRAHDTAVSQGPGLHRQRLPVQRGGRRGSRPPPLDLVDTARFMPEIELVNKRAIREPAAGPEQVVEHMSTQPKKNSNNHWRKSILKETPVQTSTSTSEMDDNSAVRAAFRADSAEELAFNTPVSGTPRPSKKKNKKKSKSKKKSDTNTTGESAPASAPASFNPERIPPASVNPVVNPPVLEPAAAYKLEDNIAGSDEKIRVTKSAPVSPENLTFQEWRRLPQDVRYAPLTHKEKLAIQTIEKVADFLHQDKMRSDAHQRDTETSVASPEKVPMIDRMAFIFARSMAKARHEVDNGVFQMNGLGTSVTRRRGGAERGDVMSSMEIEAFCFGMQEVTDPGRGGRVVMRRYWRVTQGLNPAGGVGGVIAAGQQRSSRPVKMQLGIKSYKEAAEEVPVDGVLICEVEVDRNQCLVVGEWNARGLSGWKAGDDVFGPGKGLLLG